MLVALKKGGSTEATGVGGILAALRMRRMHRSVKSKLMNTEKERSDS